MFYTPLTLLRPKLSWRASARKLIGKTPPGTCRQRPPLMVTHQTVSQRDMHIKKNNSAKELRGPTTKDIVYFQSVLSRPDRSIVTNLQHAEQNSPEEATQQQLANYNKDWTSHYIGSSPLVLRPSSTSEISTILRYCSENFIGVTPQGGNTGLCGGATPLRDEVILSLEYMNSIHNIDLHSGILTCDAGCILQNLHDYANEKGYLFPLDIGSKGTCQIGGNVSTNAGGQYFFRFGGLHGTVMGLEVVLPDGRVMSLNMETGSNADEDGVIQQKSTKGGTHRKDNTGYDLKHLFIGAEGTLGIVTKVAIACPALPTSKNATILVCDSYDNVLNVLQTAKEELGEILSAMELMDCNTLQLVQKHGFGGNDSGSRLLQDMLQSDPLEQQPGVFRPLYLLVETQGSSAENDASKMDSFLTRLYETGTIHNGFLAQDSKQMIEMWNIRESCNPSVARAGCVYKFDVSIPIDEYMDVAFEVEKQLLHSVDSSVLTVCVWGHIADGNAHINIVTLGKYEKDDALSTLIETVVYDAVLKRKGSISAEHGLGQSKNQRLDQIKEESVLNVMSQIKTLFDPHGIMNPGKYLPTKK